MKKVYILLLAIVLNIALYSCTKPGVAEEGFLIEACCGDDGDIPPPPPPPPGGDQ